MSKEQLEGTRTLVDEHRQAAAIEKVREQLDGALVDLPHNLRRKLAEVRKKIRSIAKKGTNEAQHYKFMRAEDVAGDIGDMLADMNVILARENVHVVHDLIPRGEGKTDVHVILTVDYVFVDADSNETLRISSAGEGRDTSDKALPKAFTSALKYALTQPLMMRVGDDAEDDSSETGDSRVDAHTPASTVRVVPDPEHAPARTPAQGPVISEAQGRRLFAIAQGNKKIIQNIIERYGYTDSRTIARADYEAICAQVQIDIKRAQAVEEEDIPF